MPNAICGKLKSNRPIGIKSKLNDGLEGLRQLSISWSREAEARSAPPQDEFDIPNYDVVETLLHCANELDELIKKIAD